MDYSAYKIFKINGVEKLVHDFALKKASIFAVLTDIPTDSADRDVADRNIIVPNTPDLVINQILDLLYAKNIDNFFTHVTLSKLIRATSTMMHMGLDKDIVDKCVKQLINNDLDIVGLILDPASQIEYHACLDVIIEQHKYNHSYHLSRYRNSITNSTLPDHFKVILLSKIIMRDVNYGDYDYALGFTINYKYSFDNCKLSTYCYNESLSNSIRKLYTKMDVEMDAGITISINYCKEKLVVTEIIINGKPIELVDHTQSNTPGIIGGNLLPSLSRHIAMIMMDKVTL